MPKRKKRTREHVIADISENHFERFALQIGFSTESTDKDYGYDILLFTYDQKGEIENGFVLVQLKATDSPSFIKNNTEVSFSIEKRDLNLWLKEFYPVVLVVYDASSCKGYWLYVQAYFNANRKRALAQNRKYFNVHLPMNNVINKRAMTKFKNFKDNMFAQTKNMIHVN